MSLRNLPQASLPARPRNFQWDAPSDALGRWAEMPQAAASEDANTITIYDVIGEDWWTGGGFTAKRAAGALRAIGNNPVTVNINSPGGDMFEGIAIYNLLAAHPARVTVNVMALAASAASVIAMAGDTINMGTGAFMMVHNAWGAVLGNRHEMRAAADLFDGFDAALADIYHARTGMTLPEITALMDGEGQQDGTFMSAEKAISLGFADGVMADQAPAARASAAPGTPDATLMARRRTEAALAAAGITRTERQQMLNTLGAQRDASAPPAARDAGDLEAGIRALCATLKP